MIFVTFNYRKQQIRLCKTWVLHKFMGGLHQSSGPADSLPVVRNMFDWLQSAFADAD